MVAAHRVTDLLLEGAEIAGQVRAAEFVVEGGAPIGPSIMMSSAEAMRLGLPMAFPGCTASGDVQVGDGEAAQAGLRLGTTAGGALVADLAAGAGRGAGERGEIAVGWLWVSTFIEDVRRFLPP